MRSIELIKQERQRQIEKEGWTSEHDKQHSRSELAIAAACYAVEGTKASVVRQVTSQTNYDAWPWDDQWDKRRTHSQLKRLVIAGALIAAEIDRLLRVEGDRLAEQWIKDELSGVEHIQ